MRLLTKEQKEKLTGKEFVPDNFFNPIQDINGNWVISEEEVDQSSLSWVKNLPKIEYEPKREKFKMEM